MWRGSIVVKIPKTVQDAPVKSVNLYMVYRREKDHGDKHFSLSARFPPSKTDD